MIESIVTTSLQENLKECIFHFNLKIQHTGFRVKPLLVTQSKTTTTTTTNLKRDLQRHYFETMNKEENVKKNRKVFMKESFNKSCILQFI